MTNVHCEKCGLKGASKCPYCRSVFAMDNDPLLEGADELFSHFANINPDHSVTFIALEDESVEKVLARTQRLLNQAGPGGLKILACEHEWIFDEGKRSEIGCGHYNKGG